jgi:hypothetical protein
MSQTCCEAQAVEISIICRQLFVPTPGYHFDKLRYNCCLFYLVVLLHTRFDIQTRDITEIGDRAIEMRALKKLNNLAYKIRHRCILLYTVPMLCLWNIVYRTVTQMSRV